MFFVTRKFFSRADRPKNSPKNAAEVNMNGVEGWTSIASRRFEETEAKSVLSRSSGDIESTASKEVSAFDRSDKNDAQKGFNRVHLDNYLKQDDPIMFTQVVKKRKFHGGHDR